MAEPNFSHPELTLNDTEVAFAARSNRELWKMDWLFSMMNQPTLNKMATNTLLFFIRLGLPIKPLVKYTVFNHFCGGETLEECKKTIGNLARFKIGTILDYSVEGEKNEKAFDHVMRETITTIEIAAADERVPFAVFKTSGICDVGLMEKIQFQKSTSAEENEAISRARNRFARICEAAGKKGVKLFVDAEESWIQDVIDGWAYSEMEIWNKEKALIFNTYQMYRADMLDNLKNATQRARENGYIIGAKLVRGAYMEKEAAWAEKNGKPNPIQPNKAATDRDFDAAWGFCLKNLDYIHFCAGSHNEHSNQQLAKAILQSGLAKNEPRIWFAQLFGMSDNISYGLSEAGFNVAKYVPYGPVYSVMPYLVRRAAENTSVAGQTSRELSLIKAERQRRKQQPSPSQI